MKKVIYQAKGQPVMADVEKPSPEADQMLLKTRYSAISNGTERNMMLGGNYNAKGMYPHMHVGYQAVSEVVERGASISKFSKGDLVATGTFGVHAEYHLAKESDLICQLPDSVDQVEAAFTSVAAVSWHDAKRCTVGSKDKALVSGGGPIGQFALQACKILGAHTTLLNRSEGRARVGLELGADAILFGDQASLQKQLQESAPYDVVIETTSAPGLINVLIGSANEDGVFARRGRGRIALIGGAWDVSFASNAAQRAELAVLFAQHYVQEDLEEVVDHFAAGRLRARPFIQDVVPAGQIIPYYETLRDEPSKLFGTMLDWTKL